MYLSLILQECNFTRMSGVYMNIKKLFLFFIACSGVQLFATSSMQSNEIIQVVVRNGKLYDFHHQDQEVQRLGRELVEQDFGNGIIDLGIEYRLIPKAKILSDLEFTGHRTVTRQFNVGGFTPRLRYSDPKLPELVDPLVPPVVEQPGSDLSTKPQGISGVQGVSNPVRPVIAPVKPRRPSLPAKGRNLAKSYKEQIDAVLTNHTKKSIGVVVGSGFGLLVLMTYKKFKKTLPKNHRLSSFEVAKLYAAFLGQKLQKDLKCMAVAALTGIGGGYAVYVGTGKPEVV